MKWYVIALLALCFLVSACAGKKVSISQTAENTLSAEDVAETIDNEQVIDNTLKDKNIFVSSGTMFITIGEDEDTSADFSGITYFQDHDITDIYISLLLDAGEIDFSPLSHLQHLSWVKLGGWGVTVIPDFSASPLIKHLEIRRGSLTSLDGIEAMPSLEYLEIQENREHLSDISALRYLKNLRAIRCYTGAITLNFSVLKELPNLRELYFSTSLEIDLTGIDQLRSLEILSLESNILHEIDIPCVYINIEAIGKMTWLKELYLDESITSVAFLANNTNLENLKLMADRERKDYYKVSLPLDVSPLKNLTNLKVLVLDGFNLQNAEGLDQLPNLGYLSTGGYFDK
jgi:Leucine-rich repeat (LRR) protein